MNKRNANAGIVKVKMDDRLNKGSMVLDEISRFVNLNERKTLADNFAKEIISFTDDMVDVFSEILRENGHPEVDTMSDYIALDQTGMREVLEIAENINKNYSIAVSIVEIIKDQNFAQFKEQLINRYGIYGFNGLGITTQNYKKTATYIGFTNILEIYNCAKSKNTKSLKEKVTNNNVSKVEKGSNKLQDLIYLDKEKFRSELNFISRTPALKIVLLSIIKSSVANDYNNHPKYLVLDNNKLEMNILPGYKSRIYRIIHKSEIIVNKDKKPIS